MYWTTKALFLAATIFSAFSNASKFKIEWEGWNNMACKGPSVLMPEFPLETADGQCRDLKGYPWKSSKIAQDLTLFKSSEKDLEAYGICDVLFFQDDSCQGQLVVGIPHVNGKDFHHRRCTDYEGAQARSVFVTCRDKDEPAIWSPPLET